MASNYYDKASLVMIPDAPLDGKLLSVKPQDRSGDFTFSRGSNLAATRVDANGLIEKGRENLLLQSNQFDTTWGNSNTAETGGQADKDGGTDAWLLTKSAGNGYLIQSLTPSGIQTASIYAKAGVNGWIYLQAVGTSTASCYFDLVNGTTGVTGALIDKSIESVGNGWYRCSITSNQTLSSFRIYPAEANSLSATSGSVYIQDAQLEQGLVATGYIETGASTAQAGILEDMPRLDYSGGATCPSLLLEPQRSNILTQSEYLGGEFSLDNVSLDYNYGISPEGVSNSALLTQTGSSPSNSMYEFGLTTTDGSYTYSFFFKAGTSTWCRMYTATGIAEDFNPQTITAGYSGGTLNILFEDYGNGWWRASATQTLSGASTNRFSIYPDRGNQGRNVEIWGAQVEVGSYPTSYIPTYGSSVTRSIDSTSALTYSDNINSITAFADINFEDIVRDSSTANIRIGKDTNNPSSIRVYRNSPSSKRRAVIVVSDDTNSSLFSHEVSTESAKIAIRYDSTSGDWELFVNGVSQETANNDGFEEFNTFLIGGNGGACEIKQFLIFPTALTDSECIALTTL